MSEQELDSLMKVIERLLVLTTAQQAIDLPKILEIIRAVLEALSDRELTAEEIIKIVLLVIELFR